MSIGEDIGSRSDYPSTPTRHIALTMWLWWTCLSPHGVKLKTYLQQRHHDPPGHKGHQGTEKEGASAPEPSTLNWMATHPTRTTTLMAPD